MINDCLKISNPQGSNFFLLQDSNHTGKMLNELLDNPNLLSSQDPLVIGRKRYYMISTPNMILKIHEILMDSLEMQDQHC